MQTSRRIIGRLAAAVLPVTAAAVIATGASAATFSPHGHRPPGSGSHGSGSHRAGSPAVASDRVLPDRRSVRPSPTESIATVMQPAPTPDPDPTADGSPSAAPSVPVRSPSTEALRLAGLAAPAEKNVAMMLVSSAENSSLNWQAQYAYLEDIGDGRGYTGGIIGFCSGTGDMLQVVQRYTETEPGNPLAGFLPALRAVNGTSSHAGLGAAFEAAWAAVASDRSFRAAQDYERDRVYFTPAVGQAKLDGLGPLGQFMYYDAMVMHGPGTDPASFGGIRAAAMRAARTPAQGGSQVAYLNAFLNARTAAMRAEPDHSDTTRVDTEQRVFLDAGNLDLRLPLTWKVYGDSYHLP